MGLIEAGGPGILKSDAPRSGNMLDRVFVPKDLIAYFEDRHSNRFVPFLPREQIEEFSSSLNRSDARRQKLATAIQASLAPAGAITE